MNDTKSIKRVMFKSKIISLCTKLRLGTSNLKETLTINNKFNRNLSFLIDSIIFCKVLNAFCVNNINRTIIDWNITNLNSGVTNKFQKNKMKDLLTTAACITTDDVLLLDTNNLNNNSTFTNGLSTGR